MSAEEDRCAELKLEAEKMELPSARIHEPRETRSPYLDGSGIAGARAFATDSPGGRAFLGLAANDKCSDGMIWVSSDGDDRLVFVELKMGKFQQADEQLTSCVSAWKRKVQGLPCKASLEAVVLMSGSLPSGTPNVERGFRKRNKIRLRVIAGRRSKPNAKKPSPNSRCVRLEELWLPQD